MGSNLVITKEIENYINKHSLKLNPIQKEIILYNDTRAGKIFDIFINLLIILSIVTFTIETLPNLNDSTISLLNYIEIFVVAVFSIEYILRLILDENRKKYIFNFITSIGITSY